ncbi:MAG: hypothetical protein ABIG92_06910 [Candidatus Omnitrophota bacterium]
MNCPILDFCKCNLGEICLGCKVLTVVFLIAIGSIIGYFIGKKKKK